MPPVDLARYQRQLALPGMSEIVQQKLADSKVIVLGVGGIGCACATYLAEAGVGSVVLVDPADVIESELPEQFLFRLEDVGKAKVEVAKRRLQEMNPSIEVLGIRQTFDAHNADRILDDGDVIADALGTWQGKMLASDVCMRTNKTLVHAGVRAFDFQVYTMIPGKSACLRCVFSSLGLDDVQSSHSGHGVLGPVAGMAGAFQAIEAIKIITGIGTTPGSYLIRFDALRRYYDDVSELLPQPDCPDCGMPFELPEEYP